LGSRPASSNISTLIYIFWKFPTSIGFHNGHRVFTYGLADVRDVFFNAFGKVSRHPVRELVGSAPFVGHPLRYRRPVRAMKVARYFAS